MVAAQNPPAQMNRLLALLDDWRLSSGEDAPSAHERWVKAIAVSTKATSPESTSIRGRISIVIVLGGAWPATSQSPANSLDRKGHILRIA
jgi:hypothetical protein